MDDENGVWIVQLHLGEAPSTVMAVCDSRDLALAVRDNLRTGGFVKGRLVLKYIQAVVTEEQALRTAARWIALPDDTAGEAS